MKRTIKKEENKSVFSEGKTFTRLSTGGWIWKEGFPSRKALDKARLYFFILDHLHEAVTLTNSKTNFIYINPAFEKLYKFVPCQVLAQRPDIVSPRTIPNAKKDRINKVADGTVYQVSNITASGGLVKIVLRNLPFKVDGMVIGSLGLSVQLDKTEMAVGKTVAAAVKACRLFAAEIKSNIEGQLREWDSRVLNANYDLQELASNLSPTEKTVLKLWVDYEDNKRVAQQMDAAICTVTHHKRNAFKKLKIGNLTDGERLKVVQTLKPLL